MAQRSTLRLKLRKGGKADVSAQRRRRRLAPSFAPHQDGTSASVYSTGADVEGTAHEAPTRVSGVRRGLVSAAGANHGLNPT